MDYKICLNKIWDYLKSLFWFFTSIEYFYFHICVIGTIVFLPLFLLMSFFSDIADPIVIYIEEYRYGIDAASALYIEDFLFCKDIEYLASFFGFYFLQKVLGIFKKLDKLNFFIALPIILGIYYLVTLMTKIDRQTASIIFILPVLFIIIRIIKLIINRKKMNRYDFAILFSLNLFILAMFCTSAVILTLYEGMCFDKEIQWYSKYIFLFVVAFLVYRFFYFLSKHFIICQKIGYLASFEFYKNLYSKIKSKLEKNNNICQKIRYFASFEFYKSIYSKIKSKLEKNDNICQKIRCFVSFEFYKNIYSKIKSKLEKK